MSFPLTIANGKFYPVAFRKGPQTSFYRSLPVLSKGPTEHSSALNKPLLHFNDETLAAKYSTEFAARQSQVTYLIPLSGRLNINYKGQPHIIKPGTLYILDLSAGDRIKITNPQREELSNYLILSTESMATFSKMTQFVYFDLSSAEQARQKLLEIHAIGHPSISGTFKKVSMGRYNAREDFSYYPHKREANKTLFYVVSGSFEVEGRLLQDRDGLMLWNTDQVQMESMEQDSILLIFEYATRW